MRLRLILVITLLFAGAAAAEDYDLSQDECAEPGAGCLPEMTDEELDAAENSDEAPEPVEWATGDVACPAGASNIDGRCEAINLEVDLDGGCTTGGGIGIAMVIVVLFLARKRRLLPIVVAACALDDGATWDDIDETGDPDKLDVFSAELGDGDGVQFLLAKQPLVANAQEPVAQFALAQTKGGVPILREAAACGDRLSTTDGELLGWARAESGDGTAELVELAAPDGCFVYETDPEAIAELVGEGYAITQTLAHVWPPGLADAPVAEVTDDVVDELAAPKPCKVGPRSPVILLYASPGKVETLRFLKDCPGEVVVGEKRDGGPVGAMKSPEAKAAGGRTAFVVDRNGAMLRELLNRPNGTERTAAFLRKKLALGYDYIVIDEITAHPEFRDGAGTNRRLRVLMQRLPRNKVIPYISIDLTQQPNGATDMRERRLLLRTMKRRARALALEVYLKTPQVMAGAAPFHFRRAADRLARAVKGLKYGAGINRKAITVIGTSVWGGTEKLVQYRYLNQTKSDLTSIKKQVNAIRHGSKRLRSQRGVGYYFVFRGDMMPSSGAYTYDALIRRLRTQALRF
jgi:hypothetical protein